MSGRPAYLEARLRELGGDEAALVRELLAEGWHPKNVERVLGVLGLEVLADGVRGRPEGNERASAVSGGLLDAPAPDSERRARAPTTPANAPGPRRRGSFGTAAAPPRGRATLELVARPRMFPGAGARHDCVREAECLGRALETYGQDLRAVHCPTWCKHLEAPSRDERLAAAMAGKAPGWIP